MSESQKPACLCIPQTDIPHATRLFTDLLYHYDRVSNWYAHPPLDLRSYHAAAQTLNYPASTRAEVCAVLEEQSRNFGAPPEVLANVERLRSGANVIVTGQQVGLFGGPLYSIYKALSAIKIASTLTADGLDTVPIFWIATEDHDLEEVNHAYLLTRNGDVEVVRSSSQSSAEHAPVGEIAFTDDIAAVVEKTIALLPDGDGASEIAEYLREAYRPGETFGAAFGRFMTRLFGRFGIVVMDPRSPRFRKLVAPVFRKALESAADFHHALEARDKELARHGYHSQVYVSEETSLLFVRVDGDRVPLRRKDGGFLLRGEPVSLAKLEAELDEHPEHFSPNVLLRPVVQDSLLPTLGYIGGPAELAYFAQAGAVYQGILGRMPVVAPRSTFTLVDTHSAKLMKRYNLTLPDLFKQDLAIRERFARQYMPDGLAETLAGSRMQLEAMLAALRKELEALDHTLEDATSRAGRKMAHQLRRLNDKAERAVLRRNQQVEHDAQHLLNYLHPRHSLQERVFTGLPFLARYGTSLLDVIHDKVPVRSGDHQPLFL